jgi:excinuclease ABC subunit C
MTLVSKNGVINDMKKYQFDLIADNSFESFISQYYYSNPIIPNKIYLNEIIQEKSKLELVLKKMSGHDVKIELITYKTDQDNTQDDKFVDNKILKREKFADIDKIKIMELIISNLKTYIQKSYEPALEGLKIQLKLKKIPHVIDCFDISNFGNNFAVGACTRFIDGVPYKNGYRKFKIKRISHQNDFSMMAEIINRRYSIEKQDSYLQIKEKESESKLEIDIDNDYTNDGCIRYNQEEKSKQLPDLIVIDGGKGHLNVSLKTLKKMGLEKLECISLAKENEEIFLPFKDEPLIIPKNKKELKILQHIRDESHRFGLNYNQKLRKISLQEKNK